MTLRLYAERTHDPQNQLTTGINCMQDCSPGRKHHHNTAPSGIWPFIPTRPTMSSVIAYLHLKDKEIPNLLL